MRFLRLYSLAFVVTATAMVSFLVDAAFATSSHAQLVSPLSSLPVASTPSAVPSPASPVSVDENSLTEEQRRNVSWLEMPPPELAVSNKLKQLGFAASYRLTDKQKQIVLLSTAKDLLGIVKVLTDRDYAKPSDIESAVNRAGSYDQKFIVAVQSDNAVVQGREFHIKGDVSANNYCVSVLLLPKDVEHPFLRLKDGHIYPRVYMSSGMDREFEAHPLGNGYLYRAPHGDFVVLCFLDWKVHRETNGGKVDFHNPGRMVSDAIAALRKDVEKLNKQRDLGELSPEQLVEQGHARYKTFAEAVRPFLQ